MDATLQPVLIGEFLGTLILILLGGGVVANVVLKESKGHNSGWIVITTGWFIAVCIGVFVAQSAGDINADINPAVTLAKYWLGHYSITTTLWIIPTQVTGAFCGATLVWLAYHPHWQVTADADLKRQVFCTQPAILHYPSNLLNEVIGTATLVLGIGAIFGNATSSHPASGFGPYLVGILVWGIGLSLGGATGYAINPARDLGPRIAHSILPIAGKSDSNWKYAWVPIIGPIIGSIISTIIWKYVFGG